MEKQENFCKRQAQNYVDYFQLQFYCFCFYLSLLRDIVTKLSLQKACSKIQ